MPFLTDNELDNLVARAVKKALKGNPIAENQAQVDVLIAAGEDNHERQAGRTTGSGFSAAAQGVIKESDKRRREFEDRVRNHGYER